MHLIFGEAAGKILNINHLVLQNIQGSQAGREGGRAQPDVDEDNPVLFQLRR